MKNVLLEILLLCIFSLNIHCQNSFQLIINTPNNKQCNDLVNLNDGSFIMSYLTNGGTTPYYSQHLIHVNNFGAVKNEIIISNPEGDCNIRNIISVGGGNFVGIGAWNHQNLSVEMWFIGFDTTLSVHWDKKYMLNENSIPRLHSFVDNSGSIISGAQVSPSQSVLNSGLFFMKCTPNGDSLNSKYLYSGGYYPMFDIIQQGNYYKALSKINITSYSDVLSMDTNFNVVSIDPVPEQILNCMNEKLNTDTSLYICGNVMDGIANNKIGIVQTDRMNNSVAFNYIGMGGDTINYGGADHSLDFINKNQIFIAGTANIDLNYGIYSSRPSWYILSSLDSMLNVRWVKYYYGDACYVLRSVVATADGGAILTGTRYDYKDPANKLDIYILKVNQDGIYTSVDDPVVVSHDAIIYPNPGGDYFNIQSGPQIDGAWFVLYDMQGKALIEQNIHSTHLRIDTARLPYGTYPWQIVYKGKVIESGKWVKG